MRLCSSVLVNTFQSSGHCIYHQVYESKILCSALILYLCVLYGSQNKQRLFPLYSIKLFGFYNEEEGCLLRGTSRLCKENRLRFDLEGLM